MKEAKSVLNLKQFMIRQEVLQLYRKILKTAREISNESDRNYFLNWAKQDFRANKNETNEEIIKSFVHQGKSFLKELEQSLKLSR